MPDRRPFAGWSTLRREIPATLAGLGIPAGFYAYHMARFHAHEFPHIPPEHYVALALALALGLAWSRIYRMRTQWLRRPGLIAFLCAALLPTSVKLTGDFLVLNSLFDDAFWVGLGISPLVGALAAESATKLATRIRTAEERLRRMADASTDGLWESDFRTGSVYWSESFRRNFGYLEHAPGDTFEWLREHIHHEDRPAAILAFERAMATPSAATWTGTFRFIRGDGLPVWVTSRARFERAPDGTPLFAFGDIQDISDRKARERLLESLTRELQDRIKALSEAEARTLRLARAGSDGLWTLDFESGSLLWDSAFGKAFQYPPDQVGTTLDWWRERLHPEDRPGLEAAFDRAAANPAAESWQYVYRFRRGDGTYAWVMDRCLFERDDLGRPVKAQGGILDISERMKLEEELRRRVEQRTRELAALTRSVTHDLKSPLSGILGYGDLLEASGAVGDPKAKERLRLMLRAAERMQLMIADILEQAKGGEPSTQTEPVDLMQLARDLHDEFSPRVQRLGGHLHLPEGPLPVVLSSYAPLYRILQNLIGNACKYRRDDAPPEVRVSFELRANWLILSVADNGLGIKPENLPTLFDFGARFDTQKAEGHGIGLFNVQTIARRLGGDVSVTSTPGVGSTFTVKVPGRIDMP